MIAMSLFDQELIVRALRSELGSTVDEGRLRAAANRIDALWAAEWEEIEDLDTALGASYSVQCEDICQVGEAVRKGRALRVFVRR
jgi:hypothetical protein